MLVVKAINQSINNLIQHISKNQKHKYYNQYMSNSNPPTSQTTSHLSLKRAQQLQNQGKYEQALKIYTSLLESNTPINTTQLLTQKSKVLHVIGENKEAIKTLTESIHLQETADKYCLLADLHNEIEEPQIAIQNYSKAVEIKDRFKEPETKTFLENSIVIKDLFKIKELVRENIQIEERAMAAGETPSDVDQMLRKTQKSITLILKYDYNEDIDKAKQENINDLRDMLIEMRKKIILLQEQNKKIRQQQSHFYKNHELLFNQTLESSTLSHQNQDILKAYFTTFCNKMELFFMCLKLLNKVPDSSLSMKEIYQHSQGKEEALIQVEKKLKTVVDHLDMAKGVLEQIPYVSIIFAIFRQFDKYFNKYVEKVHEEHKISNITKSWMNAQVFNDFAGDLAMRITLKMKLRILNHSEPSFKNYLKVLYSKIIKQYRFKFEAAKLKELETQKYNRKAYIEKLAERDAGIIFYAFEIERLKRKGDMQAMAGDVVKFIEEVDNIKIEQEEVDALKEEEVKKGRYCLLF